MNPFQLHEIKIIKKAFIIVKNLFSINVISSALFIFVLSFYFALNTRLYSVKSSKMGLILRVGFLTSTERQKRKDLLIWQRDKDEANLE